MRLSLPVSKAWNVTWESSAKNWSSDASALTVTYKKGGFASSSGVNFRAQPFGPSRDITLEYEAYFDDAFDFVKGGKLPGVWGGAPGSSGSDWNSKGYSCRVMWREDGAAVAYVYLCTDQGSYDGDSKNPLVRNQGKGFDDIAHHTNGAGIDLWRKDGLRLRRGAWNTIKLRVVANSPGKADGSVELAINGTSKRFDGIEWSKSGKLIEGIMFASWFGGGSKEYAPKKDQTIRFRNIQWR